MVEVNGRSAEVASCPHLGKNSPNANKVAFNLSLVSWKLITLLHVIGNWERLMHMHSPKPMTFRMNDCGEQNFKARSSI
jgi:hypothetical protein